MKQIYLKSMTLTRFKGQHSTSIVFDRITDIYGRNGSGKTTINDAFTYLSCGKDSLGRSDFDIQTINPDGSKLSRVGHTVEGVISVDGEDIEMSRTYAENWVRKTGKEEQELDGHSESFTWNKVGKILSEYKKLWASICDETVLKLITNPFTFNSDEKGAFGDSKIAMWRNRRNLLMSLAGDVSNKDIVTLNPAYADVVAKMGKYKSEDEFKKFLAASVELAKKEIKGIPHRIDELKKLMPSPLAFDKIREQISAKQTEIEKFDALLEDATKAYGELVDNARSSYQAALTKMNAHSRQVASIKSEMESREVENLKKAKKLVEKDPTALNQAKQNYDICKRDVDSLTNSIAQLNKSISEAEGKISRLTADINKSREDWASINAELCNDSTKCPSCQQDLPDDKVEEIMTKFRKNKADRLAANQANGKQMAASKADYEKDLANYNKKLASETEALNAKRTELADLKTKWGQQQESFDAKETDSFEDIYANYLANDKVYQEQQTKLKDLEDNAPKMPEEQKIEEVDNSQLKQKKSALIAEVDALKADLTKEAEIKKINTAITALEAQEREYAQQIANVDKDIFQIDDFLKLKVDEIERRVRNKFSMVTFRMFNVLGNGSLDPCCDTLINGVPFDNANTASQVNAGIDIINTLSNFYGVRAPIFIDGRESVVNIIPTESQLINLRVFPLSKLSVGAPEFPQWVHDQYAEYVSLCSMQGTEPAGIEMWVIENHETITEPAYA